MTTFKVQCKKCKAVGTGTGSVERGTAWDNVCIDDIEWDVDNLNLHNCYHEDFEVLDELDPPDFDDNVI